MRLAGTTVRSAAAAGVVALLLAAGPATPPSGGALPLAALAPGAPQVNAASVAAAITGPLSDASLGAGAVGEVMDARTGQLLWAAAPHQALLPASAAKLLTAAAALTTLRATARPVTALVTAAPVSAGTLGGDLVLRGGGDVLLTAQPSGAWPARASLDQLAAGLVASGVRRVSGALVADGSRWQGPRVAPGWRPDYLTQGSVAPVTALGVDEGGEPLTSRGDRSGDPALEAVHALRAALTRHGVTVTGPDVAGTAPSAARTLVAVSGPTVAVAVAEMLQNSDNDMAESLARQVAAARGLPASFAGASQAVTAAVEALHVPVDGLNLVDGSGLSRDDRIAPATLGGLLHLAAAPSALGGRPELRPLVAALATAGFDGTLAPRYRGDPQKAAAGVVRAKTGALLGVSALAGSVVDAQGRELLFVLVSNAVTNRSSAESALDRAAAALASL
jgi:D-alanyl-D-alanine carboxypeptidase/D-alanyl-D-alanine-endopeptidase (penicillin-binding protein 4)